MALYLLPLGAVDAVRASDMERRTLDKNSAQLPGHCDPSLTPAALVKRLRLVARALRHEANQAARGKRADADHVLMHEAGSCILQAKNAGWLSTIPALAKKIPNINPALRPTGDAAVRLQPIIAWRILA